MSDKSKGERKGTKQKKEKMKKIKPSDLFD